MFGPSCVIQFFASFLVLQASFCWLLKIKNTLNSLNSSLYVCAIGLCFCVYSEFLTHSAIG